MTIQASYYSLSNETEFKKQKVNAVAQLWQCQETGAKSLHATTKILPGDIISPLGIKEYVEKPNYLSVQVYQFPEFKQ